MKFILSINHKFFHLSPGEFINSWKKYDKDNLISGIEVYVNIKNSGELDYLKKLSQEIKKNKWILQIHGPSIDRLNEELLEYYNHISQITKQNIRITCHPIDKHQNIDHNIFESYSLFDKYSNIINKNNYNLTLLIENLNNLKGQIRPNLQDINPIYSYLNNVFLCWDIGHEVDNYECKYQLSNIQLEKLKNIHIHDIGPIEDHYPFDYDRTDYKRVMQYLKEINYKENIVLEIALDYLKGNNFDQKQINYIKQIQLLKEI